MRLEATTWLTWLEESAPATAMREGLWLYPAVETAHILGFVVLVGAAVMFDLRLLGVSRSLSVSRLARHLLRWSQGSLLVVVPTGLLLFISNATALAENPAFRLKLVFIAAAGVNAAVFHRFTFPSVSAWDRETPVPGKARVSALLSLGLWTGVITCGRLIAYV